MTSRQPNVNFQPVMPPYRIPFFTLSNQPLVRNQYLAQPQFNSITFGNYFVPESLWKEGGSWIWRDVFTSYKSWYEQIFVGGGLAIQTTFGTTLYLTKWQAAHPERLAELCGEPVLGKPSKSLRLMQSTFHQGQGARDPVAKLWVVDGKGDVRRPTSATPGPYQKKRAMLVADKEMWPAGLIHGWTLHGLRVAMRHAMTTAQVPCLCQDFDN